MRTIVSVGYGQRVAQKVDRLAVVVVGEQVGHEGAAGFHRGRWQRGSGRQDLTKCRVGRASSRRPLVFYWLRINQSFPNVRWANEFAPTGDVRAARKWNIGREGSSTRPIKCRRHAPMATCSPSTATTKRRAACDKATPVGVLRAAKFVFWCGLCWKQRGHMTG